MIGLILEGGAMRAGFVAGAVMAMMDKGLTDFAASVAVSGSVPTLAYFAAGQREYIERVWREELDTPRLLCYRNIPAASLTLSKKRPVLDLDYLVYRVFKKRFPLDTARLIGSKMSCRFAATKVPEGTLALFKPGKNDIYRVFKACLALPGCYPGTVRVGGCEYVDGGTVNPLPVESVFTGEVDRVLAVLSTPLQDEKVLPNLIGRALFWRYFHKYDWMLNKLLEASQAYRARVSLLQGLTQETPPRAFVICPDKMLPIKLLSRDKKKINQTIDLGYQKVNELEEAIRAFFEADCTRHPPDWQKHKIPYTPIQSVQLFC
jgi:predicted patatin/cPLA2 family phospholipase